MKAAYPYKRCTKVLKIVGMIVVLWGLGYYVNGHLACDHPFQNRSVYAQEAVDTPSLIKAIEVNEEEKDSLVTIKASKPLTYTVVKLQDPFRILVDIPQFATEEVIGAIAVNSAIIDEITNEQMEKGERSFCRIAIILNKDVEYDVSTEASDLLIRIAQAAVTTEETPAVKEESPITAKPADEESKIIALRINDEGDGMTVISDSAITGYKSFQMDNPHRLVVDIPDVQEKLSKKTFSFQSSLIDKIKVGQHPEKVRLAIYFKGSLPTYTIDKEENKLFVAWALPNGDEENGMRAVVRGEEAKVTKADESSPDVDDEGDED